MRHEWVLYSHKLDESKALYDCRRDPRRFFSSSTFRAMFFTFAKSSLISFTSLAVSSNAGNSHDPSSSTVGWASTTNDNISSTPITRNTRHWALDMVTVLYGHYMYTPFVLLSKVIRPNSDSMHYLLSGCTMVGPHTFHSQYNTIQYNTKKI